MIGVVQVKRALALVAALFGLVLGAVTLRAAATALFESASGADPTSIFNDIPPAPAELMNAIEWLPDPPRDGRVMEPTTRVKITDSYARALAAIDRAGRGDTAAPLADYLSGPALETALLSDGVGEVIASTFHLRQRLRLDFYSDDGSVVAIGVPEVEVVRAVDGLAGRTITATDEEWRFTMLLEDGNWRIQQLQTVTVEPPDVPGPTRPFEIPARGVNIPTAGGVGQTWTDVSVADWERDLDAAASLDAEVVRVFVAGPEFGEIDLVNLAEFLDLADARGLAAVVALFDGSPSHHPSSWLDDPAYLQDVVGGLIGHPALVAWDLKNHPDLDHELSGGSVNIDAWLARVAAIVRGIDPDTPLTVGWSSHLHTERVVNWLDVVSFQFIGEPDEFGPAIDTAVRDAAGRPVLVAGFGVPEYAGAIRGAAPAAQAERFAALMDAAERSDLVGALVWNLRDPLVAPSPGVASGSAATSFGLFTHDGEQRPVAAVYAEGASAIPDPSPLERLRGNAMLLVALSAVALVAMSLLAAQVRVRLGRRRQRRDTERPDTDESVAGSGDRRRRRFGRRASDHPDATVDHGGVDRVGRRVGDLVVVEDLPGDDGTGSAHTGRRRRAFGRRRSDRASSSVWPPPTSQPEPYTAPTKRPDPDEDASAWLEHALAAPIEGGVDDDAAAWVSSLIGESPAEAPDDPSVVPDEREHQRRWRRRSRRPSA